MPELNALKADSWKLHLPCSQLLGTVSPSILKNFILFLNQVAILASMKRKSRATLLLFAGLLAVLSACFVFSAVSCSPKSPSSTTEIKIPDVTQADPNGRLVLSLGGEVSVMNPILSQDTSSSAVEGTIFSGMVRINEALEVIP